MSRNYIKVICFSILFSGFTIAASSVVDNRLDFSEDAMIIKALLDEESGDFVQSRQMYDDLYKITGKKEYLIQEAKDTLVQKADPSHSISNLVKWITKNPTDRDDELYRMLVALYIQQGSLRDAEDVADEYLMNASVDDLVAVASLKMELNKPKDAIEILQKAYRKSEDEDIILQIANIFDKGIVEPQKATELLQRHIKEHENASIGVYFKLIELYARDKKLSKVATLYKKLYKRDPQKYFLQKIIEISLYEKDIDGIVSFLEQSKNNEEILYTFYKERKEFDKAIALTSKLYARTKKAKWLAEEGMLTYEKARKQQSVSPDSLHKMQALLEKALSQGLKDSLYLNYYGYTLIDHDLNIDRGIELIKQALKKEPSNTYYMDSLAWGLYKKGQCVQALKIMKKVVDKEGLSEEEIKTHWNLIQRCNTGKK